MLYYTWCWSDEATRNFFKIVKYGTSVIALFVHLVVFDENFKKTKFQWKKGESKLFKTDAPSLVLLLSAVYIP